MRFARLRLLSSALFATIGMTSPVAAQRVRSNQRAQPASTNVAPVYPDMLRAAGIGGVVRTTFSIDTTGRPIMSTLVVRQSDNDLFTATVKRAIARWQFVPAQRGGRAATDSIEQVVEFVHPRREFLLAMPANVLARESAGPGRWRMAVGVAPMVETGELVADALRLPIAEAALDTLFATLPPDSQYPTRIACVGLKMSGALADPPLSLLRALSGKNYTVVASRRCPRSFASSVRVLNADGTDPLPNPPGEDPWMFTPLAVRAVDDSTALIDIDMTHATSFGTYHCYARKDSARARGWRAVCQSGRMGVW